MGLFDAFKKQSCNFCDQAVGVFSRQKLTDGAYICKGCQRECSAFVDLSLFDQADVAAHIGYMERQDKIVKQVFEPANPEKISGLEPVFFADNIAMFRVQTSDSSKRDYQEVFRYDQIKSYEVFATESRNVNPDNLGDKILYDYVGIKLVLYCDNPKLFLTGSPDTDGAGTKHPWVKELEIKVISNISEKEVDVAERKVRDLIEKFDEIFGVPKRRGIFSSLQPRNKNQIISAAELADGFFKAVQSMSKGTSASGGLELSQNALIDLISQNRSKYTRLADSAEQKIELV